MVSGLLIDIFDICQSDMKELLCYTCAIFVHVTNL